LTDCFITGSAEMDAAVGTETEGYTE
jgi:hypothetical protein